MNPGRSPDAGSGGRGALLGMGVVLMLVGFALAAMDYYRFCPPGANCGTGDPTADLGLALMFIFFGLVLAAVGALYRPRPAQSG